MNNRISNPPISTGLKEKPAENVFISVFYMQYFYSLNTPTNKKGPNKVRSQGCVYINIIKILVL